MAVSICSTYRMSNKMWRTIRRKKGRLELVACVKLELTGLTISFVMSTTSRIYTGSVYKLQCLSRQGRTKCFW